MSPRSGEKWTLASGCDKSGWQEQPTCGQLSGHRQADGELCGVPLSLLTNATGKTACLMHSVPEAEKRAITSKGGAVTARAVRNPTAVNPSLRTMPQILAYIEETGGRLDRGEITERGANSRMQVADKAIRAHSENLADRLTELEELVAKRARSASARVVRVLR